MHKNLVIVESPAKAKKIEKFLGKDFVVKSSFGHIRDLAKKGLGIDVENNFNLAYEVPSDKRKIVDELTKLAQSAEQVWLASDEDREGEAIAWHLTEVLGLDIERTKRIVFHEITKSAILEAVENPRRVDLNLVNAQQARRALDRLVGFELSPVLWRKVRPQLSAGRVQSVVVRLLVTREREIIGFKSTPYFRVVAEFCGGDDQRSVFKAELTNRLSTQAEAEAFLQACIGAEFTITKVEEKPLKRYPAPPFTTSTLQQEAGRKLGMSVSQTMSLAQKLYEQGLITYMRTDSVNLSNQALAMCREQIATHYGENYSSIHNYKTKSKGAQEAHEAIRPSCIDNQSIEGTPAERRLYDLIWKRTVASQMVPAEVERTIVTIDRQGGEKATFTATGEVMKFDGFMKLYTESSDDDAAQGELSDKSLLPKLTAGQSVDRVTISATERFTQPPARFNEASLVKEMQELGIGRPSTYAPTITTIINRGYVDKQNTDGTERSYAQLVLSEDVVSCSTKTEVYGKEKRRLAPTDIAMLVTDYLEQQFSDILDYNFTANVEREFDRIAEGEISWSQMIDDFYRPFHTLVNSAVETQVSHSAHERVLGIDPATGRQVKARIGRYGPMVEIVGAEPSEEEKAEAARLEAEAAEAAKAAEEAAPAKRGRKPKAAKTTKAKSTVKSADKPKYAALKRGQLIESITLEQALELFALPRTLGEMEGEELVVGIGRFGAYVRHGKSFTSLAKTDDPYTITQERAEELVRTQREARAAANIPLKSFTEDEEMLIKNGRYGPYIAYNSKNYKIPKGVKPEDLSYEEAMQIVKSSKK
ncbi:MAG: type I DNA topoisomerase [Rikenellaceae bacterium]